MLRLSWQGSGAQVKGFESRTTILRRRRRSRGIGIAGVAAPRLSASHHHCRRRWRHQESSRRVPSALRAYWFAATLFAH